VVDHLDVIAILGAALLLGSIVAAIVLRIRLRRTRRRMPPARAWWVAPSAVTVALAVSTVVLGVQDLEVALFWTLAWLAWMPLVWGAALAARLLWSAWRARSGSTGPHGDPGTRH